MQIIGTYFSARALHQSSSTNRLFTKRASIGIRKNQLPHFSLSPLSRATLAKMDANARISGELFQFQKFPFGKATTLGTKMKSKNILSLYEMR